MIVREGGKRMRADEWELKWPLCYNDTITAFTRSRLTSLTHPSFPCPPFLCHIMKLPLASLFLSLATSLASAAPPNILFAIADDWGAHASAYGTPWIKTPAFDRVAKEGLLF